MSAVEEKRRKALGKGIGALLAQRSATREQEAGGSAAPEALRTLPASLIEPNPLQPRTEFDEEKLEELAQSIRANGIIQPLVVRRAGSRYQLVAGERRLRAAQLAGLEEVPVTVRDIPDERLLEITLIENIQREDLNPIEVARAYERLIRDLDLSHEELGKRTGKNRVTITNLLRLLKLPSPLQQLVAGGQLQMGHARALLALPDPNDQMLLAVQIVDQRLSVRQVERMVRQVLKRISEGPKPAPPPPDPNVAAAVSELESALGTKVRVVERGNQKGRIVIDYYSLEDLHRIYQRIVGEEE